MKNAKINPLCLDLSLEPFLLKSFVSTAPTSWPPPTIMGGESDFSFFRALV